MCLKFIKVIILLLIHATGCFCQLSADAEFRFRAEYRDGYKILPESTCDPSILLSFRTRLNVSLKFSKFNFKLVPQDTRAVNNQKFLNATGMNIPFTGIRLREVCMDYSPNEAISLKIGRQEFFINDQRLMARRNWNQDGIGYDMIRFAYHRNDAMLQAGFSYLLFPESTNGYDYPNAKYKTFNFINFIKIFKSDLKIAVTSVLSGNYAADSLSGFFYQNTSGVYMEYNRKIFGFHGSLYLQYGKNNALEKVSAYLSDVHVECHIRRFRYQAGVAIISGNDQSGNRGYDHTFDLLYGVRHSFYGIMDHFSEMDESTFNSGIIDRYFSVSSVFNRKLNVEAGIHAISMEGDNYKSYPSFGSLNRYLATETDLALMYDFNNGIQAEAGYCFLVPSMTYRSFINKTGFDFSDFAYLMITLTPEFVKPKKK